MEQQTQEHLTLEKLPAAFSHLHSDIRDIKALLLALNNPSQSALTPIEKPINIQRTAELTGLSVQTIYGKVSRREIPFNKQGKRLYFYQSELSAWIRSGRHKTSSEIQSEADNYLHSTKRK